MLVIILIVAFILLLIIYLVAAFRRHDPDSAVDQERDPFFGEMARLAAAGLLYEQEERSFGRPRKSYTVTPAGEAALRTWLREPMNDPGMVRLYFAGIVGPADVVSLTRQQRQRHEQRVEHYRRIEALLSGGDADWDSARRTVELGRRFEEACLSFWANEIDLPMNAVPDPDRHRAA
ncbi:PadR family transcriptional regulator [Jiella sp. M17.18]|uniref:PadR family transcriptional regulator n=1 Tax=Jiella sp. M17.18 TaxID=3234247 RepID=UPI0034DE0BA2